MLNIISIDSLPFETISAQNGNNAIGQGRDGENKASQSEENSQSTNQNSMCISRDSILLRCNNVAEEKIGGSIGSGEHSTPGPLGPQGEKGDTNTTGPMGSTGPSSVDGRVYVVVGEAFGGKDH